jgi:succinate-semialdehyde dehydrogenase / glutarate-semialdehyde dehydrogenase
MYTSLEHYIDGSWVKASGAKTQEVVNPATSKSIGELRHASRGDLDKALAAADKGFKTWRKVSAYERGKILHKAADLVRARGRGDRQGTDPRTGQGADGGQARGA